VAAHSANCRDTLILVSPDTRALAGRPPVRPATVAAMQFAMIAGAPYAFTSDDVIFSVHADRAGRPALERRASNWTRKGHSNTAQRTLEHFESAASCFRKSNPIFGPMQ